MVERCGKERLTRIRVRQEGADREQDFADCQSRAPLVLEDVQADLPTVVNVAVVNAGAEGHLQHEKELRNAQSTVLFCQRARRFY